MKKYQEWKRDYPEFQPNLTPREIFTRGSFGGGYWRPINSGVLHKKLANRHHHKNISTLFRGIPEKKLSSTIYDANVNKYQVSCGSSLEAWESKNWIKAQDPYGWVEWYCHFYQGRRSDDDRRQINRWLALAGPRGRFRVRLINMIRNKNTSVNDYSVSPVIRQTLQHWGYTLRAKDIH